MSAVARGSRVRRRVGLPLGVLLVAALVTPCATGWSAATVSLTSMFSTDAEGWHVVTGNSTTSDPTYVATGGNPGGYLELANDEALKRFVAPVSWEKDLSGDYAGTINFDLRVADSDLADSYARVELYRAQGYYATEIAKPLTTDWADFSVRLLAGRWCLPGGGCLTRSQLTDYLATAPVLRIRIFNQDEVATTQHTDLDNVSVQGPAQVTRRVSLKYRTGAKAFTGHLKAPASSCASHQKVQVYKRHTGPDTRVGSDTTSAVGAYRVHARRRPGKYYAQVQEKLLGKAGLNCLAAVSPVVTVT